ncbi:hypothetical protein K0U00_49555, partial [Paenibacillus sepulcri]|nr:hypothetical protein [Paenibacillus sepulcri]
VKVSMPAAALLDALQARSDAAIRVSVDGRSLLLQLGAIGNLPETANVSVTITQASDAASAALKEALSRQGAIPLLEHPIAFALDADGRWIDNGRYAERSIALPATADPDKTTAVWIDAKGGL